MSTEPHERWMRHCLDLAARGAGHVSSNPMVGAVLIGPEGNLVGEGWHAAYGGPHAEVHAVADAEQRHGPDALRQATLYVNLEPCSHHGKTPPCTDLILDKQIGRVVVGMEDPFPEVAGRGIARLRAQNVEVTTGVLEHDCRRFNEAFLHHVATGRPLVTVKVAQTLDGQVATTTGDARWVSSPASRRLTHRWRAELDGVLVGSGTARRDDPALTVRHVEGRQPVRIVLDRAGALPPSLQVFNDAYVGFTTAVIGEAAMPAYAASLQAVGGRLVRLPVGNNNHLDLHVLMDHLGRKGSLNGQPMQSLLVEAGPGLATALFQQDLVDRYMAFVTPKLIGTGLPTLGAFGIEHMADAYTFAEHAWKPVGEDMLFQGYVREV